MKAGLGVRCRTIVKLFSKDGTVKEIREVYSGPFGDKELIVIPGGGSDVKSDS